MKFFSRLGDTFGKEHGADTAAPYNSKFHKTDPPWLR